MPQSLKILFVVCPSLFASSILSAQIRPGDGHFFNRDVIPRDSSRVIPPKPVPQTNRATTYITLTLERAWTNSEGKTLQGKLIAFEDMVVEVPAGQTIEPAKPPAHPTVVDKEGKVRLLINNKPFVLPLDKMSPADQVEIRKIESAHAPKPKPNP